MKDIEHDLHIWAKPATERCSALFTVSQGRTTICVDLILDEALERIADHMRDMVGES